MIVSINTTHKIQRTSLEKKGGESMETKDLKKYLAGFGIVGLIAGAGLAVGANTGNAESG